MQNIFATPGVPEVVANLFPNLPNFIAHILSTIVVLLVLSKYVYKPFTKVVNDRREQITALLSEADAKTKEAEKTLEQANLELKDATIRSNQIIQSARSEADIEKLKILSSAKVDAANLQAYATKAIVREREEAQKEIHESIINVAMSAAQKILESEISKEKNEKLIEDFIHNLDK